MKTDLKVIKVFVAMRRAQFKESHGHPTPHGAAGSEGVRPGAGVGLADPTAKSAAAQNLAVLTETQKALFDPATNSAGRKRRLRDISSSRRSKSAGQGVVAPCQSLAGRPVLMAGTALVAFRKLASDMAAKAMMPARISSLFLIELPSLTRRCFNSSSLRYSSLGMVKLSRTSFGFLALSNLTSAGFVVGATAVLGSAFTGLFTATLAATVGVVLTFEVTAALVTALFGIGLIATLATGLTGAAIFLAGVFTILLVTALTAAGVGTGSEAAALLTLGWSAWTVTGSLARSGCIVDDVMCAFFEFKQGK
jgi:hypothetical protein